MVKAYNHQFHNHEEIPYAAIGSGLTPCVPAGTGNTDSVSVIPERELDLDEVVVVAKRPVLMQQEGKLTYIVKNDPYAKGLDGITLLGRIPRVAVNNGTVSVAGKGNVRYIIDGILLELDASATAMRLQNLRAEEIEKVELLTTPPSRYASEPDAVYISIITRNGTGAALARSVSVAQPVWGAPISGS